MKRINSKLFCLLIFTGTAILTANSCKKESNPPIDGSGTVIDYDQNVYHTITIGKQTWMVENLRTTHYNDGGNITNSTDPADWNYINTTPDFCVYHNTNNADTISTYGLLYNWYAVNTGKLCPKGWHVPSDAEWDTLVATLGGTAIAGGKLKESGTTHWSVPNTGADNSSGFSALPGGNRTSGDFTMGFQGYWWSSTETNILLAGICHLNFSYSTANMETALKSYGHSVRCIKGTPAK